MDIETIARTCHEANRAYCRALGDTSHIPWDALSDDARRAVYVGVEKALANPGLSGEQAHQFWLEHKARAGWKYGATRDESEKLHPCMLPYHMLPVSERRKDVLFLSVVNALRD